MIDKASITTNIMHQLLLTPLGRTDHSIVRDIATRLTGIVVDAVQAHTHDLQQRCELAEKRATELGQLADSVEDMEAIGRATTEIFNILTRKETP
tara:strand:+ start:1046 stop:1330 length:285 start_codon:yes stop_codon:yes gene_type:complete